jgi:hypothetical protein
MLETTFHAQQTGDMEVYHQTPLSSLGYCRALFRRKPYILYRCVDTRATEKKLCGRLVFGTTSVAPVPSRCAPHRCSGIQGTAQMAKIANYADVPLKLRRRWRGSASQGADHSGHATTQVVNFISGNKCLPQTSDSVRRGLPAGGQHGGLRTIASWAA